jgi:hypothetical protein
MRNQIDKPLIFSNVNKCNIVINSDIRSLNQSFGSNTDKILNDFLKREIEILRSQLEFTQNLLEKFIKKGGNNE